MLKIKDSVILCLVSGLIGTSFMAASNLIRFKRNTTEMLYGHLAGSIILAPFRLNNRENFILGQLYHFISGVIIAFPLYYVFKTTGTDHHRVKGASYGLLTWSTLFGIGKKTGLFVRPRLTKTLYSAIQNNIIYGLVTAEAMIRLGDSRLFRPNATPVVQSQQPLPLSDPADQPHQPHDKLLIH